MKIVPAERRGTGISGYVIMWRVTMIQMVITAGIALICRRRF